MKTRIQSYAYMLVLAAMAAGCAEQQPMSDEAQSEGLHVYASLPTTRIVMESDGDRTHALWQEDDQIGLFAEGWTNVSYDVSATDGHTAEFAPTYYHQVPDIEDGQVVSAYAPYADGSTADGVLYSMASASSPLVYAQATVTDQALNLSFRHALAYLRIDLNQSAFPQIQAPVFYHFSLSSPNGLIGQGTLDLQTHEFRVAEAETYRHTPDSPVDLATSAWTSPYIPVAPGRDGQIDIYAQINGRNTLVTSRRAPEGGFQAGAVYTLSPDSEDFILRIILSDKTLSVDAEGGVLEVDLQANTDFEMTVLNADWIRQADTRSLTAQTARLLVDPNPATESRTAQVVFHARTRQDAEGTTSMPQTTAIDTLTVVQAAYGHERRVDMEEAGTLSTLISEADKNDITSLTLSGPINGDDVRFIREMENLLSLDLGDARIVAGGEAYYSNSRGSYGTVANLVGPYMFYRLGLQSVVLPKSTTELGNYALSGNDITTLTVPDGVTHIGIGCFEEDLSLRSITLPPSLTSIDDRAFNSCYGMTELHISDAVRWSEVRLSTRWSHPFSNSGSYSGGSTDGCTLYMNGEAISTLHIPSSVQAVGDYVFMHCQNLTSVTIDNGVTRVGEWAFYDCQSLTTVEFPGSITSLGQYAFAGTSLEHISLPDGLTEISGALFQDTDLKEIVIPQSVKTIQTNAFWGCANLQTVSLPDELVSIGNNAFYECTSLDDIDLPQTLQTIGEAAFFDCTSLSSIRIPASVQVIGVDAFEYCSSLHVLHIDDLERWCYISFPRGDIGKQPGNPMRQAKEVYIGGERLTDLTIPDGVTTIGNFAFMGFEQMKTLNLKQVGKIGEYAFSYCDGLTEVRTEVVIPPTLSANAFAELPTDCRLYVPSEAYDDYLASDWAEIFGEIVGE